MIQLAGYSQEEYSFDISEIKKNPFQFSGFLEGRPVFSFINKNSRFTLLRFYADTIDKRILDHNFKTLLDASFEKGITTARAKLNIELNYSRPDWSFQTRFYEGYFSLKPSLHFQIDVGKKRLKWGKGYAWNPVAFIDNPKNPNDQDLALEGFTVLSVDYIKSFPGKLKTLTFTPVLLPVFKHINNNIGRSNTINLGGKLYLLLFNTDIDFLFLMGPGVSSRFGVDFSRNLASNFEIHGEWAYVSNFSKNLDWEESKPVTNVSYTSYLLGIRFLTKLNTTFILEYYRNGMGYTQEEMDEYYSNIDQAYIEFQKTEDENHLKQASSMTGYRSFTPMQNYLFMRVSQKEPFDILYFTPSLTSICNLKDGSFSITPELLYNPVTNLQLRFRAVFLNGKKGTEFGEKQNNFRLELRCRYYF
jgi:hypothetical protein